MGTQSAIDEVDIRRRIEASEVAARFATHRLTGCAPAQQPVPIVDTQDIDTVGFPRYHSLPEAVRGSSRCSAVSNRSRQGDGL